MRTLFSLFVAAALTLAGCDTDFRPRNDAPLPSNLTITSAADVLPEVSKLLGIWEGQYSDFRNVKVAVTEIRGNQATVVYGWGAGGGLSIASRIAGHDQPTLAEVVDNKIVWSKIRNDRIIKLTLTHNPKTGGVELWYQSHYLNGSPSYGPIKADLSKTQGTGSTRLATR